MTRRRNKKPLYNNVYSQLSTKQTSASIAASNGVSAVTLDSVSVTFSHMLLKTGVLCLLISFVLQPVFAHAQESEVVGLPEVVEDAATATVETDEERSPELAAENDNTELLEREENNEADEAEKLVVQVDEAEVPEEVIESEEQALDEATEVQSEHIATSSVDTTEDVVLESNVEIASSSEPEAPDAPTVDEQEQATTTEEQSTGGNGSQQESSDQATENERTDQVTATTSEEIADDRTSNEKEERNNTDDEPTASSTEQSVASTTEEANSNVVTITQTTAAYAFTKDECTLVEDGSYYCQKADVTPVKQDDLYAELDSDGDLEIFLRRDGEERQITQNIVDDASPYFDTRSNSIVWHRLVNDRYQIVSYDISDMEEEVLTNTKVNNMEPSRSGDLIVWQRWIDNNWEIILYSNGEETQLTDSIEHDIAPSVRGDIVIWSVRSSDGTHSLRTYDVSSGVYNDINDPDGVAVANPRMVVMYDAVYSNGDTVMKGFDLVTGELIPLQQTPTELPEQLPEPDSTGETRALVSPSPSKPEQEDQDADPDPEPEEPVGPDPVLDLSTTTTSTSTSPLAVDNTDFDLDLRASTTEDIIPVPDIEDVVVPATSTASTSSQT